MWYSNRDRICILLHYCRDALKGLLIIPALLIYFTVVMFLCSAIGQQCVSMMFPMATNKANMTAASTTQLRRSLSYV